MDKEATWERSISRLRRLITRPRIRRAGKVLGARLPLIPYEWLIVLRTIGHSCVFKRLGLLFQLLVRNSFGIGQISPTQFSAAQISTAQVSIRQVGLPQVGIR